jgi:hypothetical protein
MKTINGRNRSFLGSNFICTLVLALASFLLPTVMALAQVPPPIGGYYGPTNVPLASWSFQDHTTWTDDESNAPISFGNLNFSYLGDGASLMVNTNLPAWLNYYVYEPTTGTTNLTIDNGSLTLWYAPQWNSLNVTNTVGTGSGDWAQLIDVGEWSANASSSYWGLAIDPTGTNLWFVSQDGAGNTYSMSTPISWTSNYFHFIALTYSPTNVSIYLDGQLATNDPGGLSILPNSDVLADGVYFGSNTNGLMQAQGLFNTVATYNYPLSSNDVQTLFNWNYTYYEISPWNTAMFNIASAPSNPSTNPVTPDVITGAGYLQWDGSVTPHYSTNANVVWITNITTAAASGGIENVTFTIQGGEAGYFYDVFATGALESPLPNALWFWMGQGNSGNTYTLPISSTDAFIILGTPQDSDGDGLTDAYELLVSHTDPHNADSNLDGILDGWDILLGLNPQLNNANTSSERANYGYTQADWVNGVTGVKSGTITTDNEGNVTSVSQ